MSLNVLLCARQVISAVSPMIEKNKHRANFKLRHARMQSNKQVLPEYSLESISRGKITVLIVDGI